MATINETRAQLEGTFIDAWGSITPIAYDNVSFNDKDLDEFVEIRFVPYDKYNATTGHISTHLTGALVIAIYTKYNTGSGRSWDLADQVDSIMSNKSIGSDIFTVSAEPRRNGDEQEGWYSVLVSIPFTSHECSI